MNNAVRKSPITWIPTAYFAMGLPFVVINMVISIMYSRMGVADEVITRWTSLLILPWTLKPLWSPFLELYKTKKFFVIITQLISGVTFGLVAFCLHLPDYFVISLALFAIIAFSGATHDVACDGVYMGVLSNKEQSKYIGWQGAFYNIAKIVATGGLVYLAGFLLERLSNGTPESIKAVTPQVWSYIMGIIAGIFLFIGFYHMMFLPSPPQKEKNVRTAREVMHELKSSLTGFFKKRHIVYYICFIFLYRLAEGFAVKIVPLFLLASRENGGLGLNEKEIGIYLGTYGAAAFVLGSLLAGYYISAKGLKNTLFKLCACFNIPFAVYAFFAFFQPTNDWLIAGGIIFEYFGYGFGFVGLSLFMMQQIAPGEQQMAHYAFATGIMNLGVMIPGSISGDLCRVFENMFGSPGGYAPFFIFVLIACIPAFFITYFIPFTYDDKGNRI